MENEFELDVVRINEMQTMFSRLVEDCPMPSTDELAKMLAFQGYCWQKLSVLEAQIAGELGVSQGMTPKEYTRFSKRLQLALQLGKEARECFTKSADMIASSKALEDKIEKMVEEQVEDFKDDLAMKTALECGLTYEELRGDTKRRKA